MDLEELIKHNNDNVEVDYSDGIKNRLLTTFGVNRRVQGRLSISSSGMDGYRYMSVHGDGDYRFAILENGYTAQKLETEMRGETLVYRPDGTLAREKDGRIWPIPKNVPILVPGDIRILRCYHESDP